MYKVFFVDDEAAMRAGIRNNMNWETSGFTLAGEAPDGEMALSLMQDLLPDILITDVKMPFMDGIELARRTKQDMPWVRIILLSGHDEFEYARQAISIGVEEYLLKPVTSAGLFETLDRTAKKIEAGKERERTERERLLAMPGLGVSGLIPLPDGDERSVMERIRNASRQDIPGILDDYLCQFDGAVTRSFIFLNYMFMDVISLASQLIKEQNGDPRRILTDYSGAGMPAETISDMETAKTMMESILGKAIEFRDTVAGSKYNDVIRKAQEYIHSHYREQGLSLNTVAAEVNVSPNHFSTIFSQETGETFINYITRIRLDQAKTLLKTTAMRTADIAYDVGYNDTHYFSYVFKKNLGMSPKEFRTSEYS